MAKNEKEVNKKKGHFFKDIKAELKKVVWPSAKQTTNNTVAVIAFTLALAVIVFALDVCFDIMNKKGIVALQEKVTSSFSSKSDENTTNESSEENNTTAENNTSTDTNATNVQVEANTQTSENKTEESTSNKTENTTSNETANNTKSQE